VAPLLKKLTKSLLIGQKRNSFSWIVCINIHMKKRVNVTIDARLHKFIVEQEMNFSSWLNEQVRSLSSSVASELSKESKKNDK
jgi:hypothetical protein